MKAKDVRVGSFYACKVSGNHVVVKVLTINDNRIEVLNTKTKRTIWLRSARRLQGEVGDPSLPIKRFRLELTIEKDGEKKSVTRYCKATDEKAAEETARRYYRSAPASGKLISVDKTEEAEDQPRQNA